MNIQIKKYMEQISFKQKIKRQYDLGLEYNQFLLPIIDQSYVQLSYSASPVISIMLEDVIKSIVGEINFKSESFLRNTGILISFDIINLLITSIKLHDNQSIFFRYKPDIIGQDIVFDNICYQILENGNYKIYSDDNGMREKIELPNHFPDNFWEWDDDHFLMLKLML